MTSRERVKAAVKHEPPDRLPCHENFWEDTLPAWQEQGYPGGADPTDYFGFDLCFMSLDSSPRFEQRVLRHEGEYVVYADRFGYTVKRQQGKGSTMHFSDHKTCDRAAWEQIRPRFTLSDDPTESARIDDASYFAHLDPYPSWDEAVEKYRRIHASDRYLLFDAYGPWEATWRHRGYEDLLMDVATDADWIKEMADTYQDLVITILDRCLALGMKPDGFFAVDDLAYTGGLLISPATWRQVFKPAVERLGQFLRDNGIDFWMHSCGDVRELIDDLLDCGLQVLNPLQASAGLDVAALRQRYGTRLAYYGGIDVRNLIGSQSALAAELERKLAGARAGGYILHSDHSVPPQVSFERYRWMLASARGER